jgi:CHAD domain-containing protein
VEIEAKFSFRDQSAFAGWLTSPTLGRFKLGPARLMHTADEYVDSAGQACLRGGYACRLRSSGMSVVATLKSLADSSEAALGAVRRRTELEAPLQPPRTALRPAASGEAAPAWQQPAQWPPSEARTLALRLLAGEPLGHLAWIWQERYERALLDGERTVALFSLDRVRFEGDRAPMLELEVELTSTGTEADLAEVVHVLQDDPAFENQPRSKLQRALEGTAAPSPGEAQEPAKGAKQQPAPHQRVPAEGDGTGRSCHDGSVQARPDDTQASAGRRVLAGQFEKFQRAVDGFDGDDPAEALHDARVAVRRMRTLLRMFKRVFPRRRQRRHLKRLTRLGDLLGAVRDLDVQLQDAAEAQQCLPQGGLDVLIAAWQADRAAAVADLLRLLHGDRIAAWQTSFQRFLEAGSGGRDGDLRLCDTLPALVWGRYGAVRAYDPGLERATLVRLHELRKELKQLRYLLEFFEDLLGDGVRSLVKRTIGVQDALGLLHDSVAIAERLEATDADAAAVAQYRQRTLEAIRTRRHEFESIWPSLCDQRFRRDLARVVSGV